MLRRTSPLLFSPQEPIFTTAMSGGAPASWLGALSGKACCDGGRAEVQEMVERSLPRSLLLERLFPKAEHILTEQVCMIVLPPAFPYGGMENPVMTFLTPTSIAGDRSNNGLVAHELAHSWSGNLTIYSSWRDGWRNEGVTSYFENHIVEAVYGKERAEQEYALSYAGLVEGIDEIGADNPNTAMRTPAAISPFDTRGFAIYDKGTVFLRTVENIIGRDKFDAWLTQWFDTHAFEPVTSEMFLADLRAKLIGDDAELENRLMLDEWVYGTSLPENAWKPDSEAFAEVDGAVTAYASAGTLPDADSWRGWTAAEQRRFLEELPQELSSEQLAALDTTLGLSQTANNEVLFLWLEAAMRNEYGPAVPQAEGFWQGWDATSLSVRCSRRLTTRLGVSPSLSVSIPKRVAATMPVPAAMWTRRFSTRRLRKRCFRLNVCKPKSAFGPIAESPVLVSPNRKPDIRFRTHLQTCDLTRI